MTGTVRNESCLAWFFFIRALAARPLYPFNQGVRFCADGLLWKRWLSLFCGWQIRLAKTFFIFFLQYFALINQKKSPLKRELANNVKTIANIIMSEWTARHTIHKNRTAKHRTPITIIRNRNSNWHNDKIERWKKNKCEAEYGNGQKKSKDKCWVCAAGFVFKAWLFLSAVLMLNKELSARIFAVVD